MENCKIGTCVLINFFNKILFILSYIINIYYVILFFLQENLYLTLKRSGGEGGCSANPS